MQPKNDNPSFFDPKTLIAVASVALIYFGWQTYLGKKYPGYGAANQAQKTTVSEQAKTTPVPTSSGSVVDAKSEILVAPTVVEQSFKFSNDKVAFTLTNHGMGLKDVTINNYKDKKQENIKIGVSKDISLFEMRWAGDEKPLDFNVVEVEPGHFVGSAQVGETVIKRELKYVAESAHFSNKITVVNPTEEFKKGFSLFIPESIHTPESSSFLFPSYEMQDFFVVHNGGKAESINFSGAKDNLSQELSSSSLLSVGSQYFAAVILDKSEVLPNAKISANIAGKSALGELVYKPIQLKQEMTFESIFYAGPKSIEALKVVDASLPAIVDFGFFGFIARPLLFIMQTSYSVVGNWGFAIILLTLIVRLCVLPFNIMSFRSMKAMQKVQPAIQALREKYKEDPMRLNQEMMAVMKENGANPVGGCLPMLLQIPIFFALYRVIGSSVDLYGSPFIGWIHDLSSYDPYYVLPVLMSVFMFIQQKITPSTMDPMQAKIMLFLPVVFSLFMLQLPSGLTLYMVVSTLFGIVQQYLIMREKSPSPANKKA